MRPVYLLIFLNNTQGHRRAVDVVTFGELVFLKTAQSIMGHASADMTMRYADTELSQVQAASNVLGGAFSVGN